MKLRFIFFLFLFVTALSFSQVVNNLIVFSNEGLKFTLIMNGERYNNTPETKVRVTNLILKKYQVKIIFEDAKMKDVNTTLTFHSTGWECQFALNKKGSKKHKMEFFTQTRMEGFDPPAQNLNSGNNSINSNNNSNNNSSNNVSSTPTLAPTQPATVTTGNGTAPNDQTGININPNTGNVGITIGNEQFNIFKSDVIKQVNDAAKETKAYELLKNSVLLSSQVKETMKLLSTEKAKLDFAKKAYTNTKDKENYPQLLDLFTVPALKEDLKKFIESKK